ncbi:hypothetical protein JMN32_19900 [Fulvivirga sp. 29W222]|uniref:Tetratricopeptide repeat protein n=1 Tax=Fulvivirga marina TaxID=2494733 RepID=A0A937FYS4_9BACT|nr:hypothetical protein [Fulvivirga marina]MBL6448585.1 hypothetical protein [Fulvivirga marina]
MKHFLIVILLFFVSKSAIGCGWGPDNDLYFFYNLFHQSNISNKAYYPFLRDESHTFYEGMDGELEIDIHSGNVAQWQQLLSNWSTGDIKKALFAKTDEEFLQVWSGKRGTQENKAKVYMAFARKCSQAFAHRSYYSWQYEEIKKATPADIAALLKEGMLKYQEEQNEQLKTRYAYQVVRILHYTEQFQEAIDFYNAHVTKDAASEIDYYLLDQVAGCHYSLHDYEKAAYMFLTVFENSTDRKPSAYLSYKFCVDEGAEGKTYFKGSEDKATYITIKSLRDFTDVLSGLRELYTTSPNDRKLELLFTRALNAIEREAWPTNVGLSEYVLPALKDSDQKQLRELQQLAYTIYNDKKTENKDFWKLADSYLSFLQKDIIAAKDKLSAVKSSIYADQVNTLKHIYEVFSWKSIGAKEEAYLANVIGDLKGDAYYYLSSENWKHLVQDQAGHLYYRKGQLAKAFLTHNDLDRLRYINSLALIEDFEKLAAQGTYNSFEKQLIDRTRNTTGKHGLAEYVKFVKGVYYLLQADPAKALAQLKDNPMSAQSGIDMSNFVSARVFSNNIMECFDCEEIEVMEDSVFLASVYSFIKPTFSKADLAANLLKLDSMTQDTKQWKRKLSHYLLANYYFNVSNTGYFRGTLVGDGNCCNYDYFPYSKGEMTSEEYIADNRGYNLYYLDGKKRSDYHLAEKAYEHYQKVIENSTDTELNARCLYMMAKCELNRLYNETPNRYWYYKGEVSEVELPYKKSFQKLKAEYQSTKFYSKIIDECSFFRYYDGL